MITRPLHRLAVIGAAVAALAMLGGTASAAMIDSACPLGYTCTTTYYSDSTHTTVVGGSWTDCDGQTSTSGTRSPYMTYSRAAC